MRWAEFSGMKSPARVLMSISRVWRSKLWKTWEISQRKQKSLCHVRLFATPWTIHSMEFSKPQYWSGYLFLLQGIFPTQGSNPGLPSCRWILYQLSHQGSPGEGFPRSTIKWPTHYLLWFGGVSVSQAGNTIALFPALHTHSANSFSF